jgi:serine/threonine-protein kinase
MERFELVRPLGDGAAGSVFLVKDRQNGGAEVALKILVNSGAFDENTYARFLEEMRTSAAVRHPNIVQAYEFLQLTDTIAFTMEWVDGKNLGQLFEERRFDYEEVDYIFDQLLSALGELHDHGIVHRDIKLENILLAYDGTVKLSDLGLMKRINSEGLTRSGVLLGTAQYLPPEYVQQGHYDVRGDIFALGTVLYELLTGERRFSDKFGMEVIEQRIKNNFSIPKIALTNLPRKYYYLLSRSMDRDPTVRFQSVDEMLMGFQQVPGGSWPCIEQGALESSIGFQNIPGVDDPAALNERRASRAFRALVLALAVGGMILLLGGISFLWNNYRSFNIMDIGVYRGVVTLEGNDVPAEIVSDQRGMRFRSGVPWCKTGLVNRFLSQVHCTGGTRVKIELGSVRDGVYDGTFTEKKSGLKMDWKLERLQRDIISG